MHSVGMTGFLSFIQNALRFRETAIFEERLPILGDGEFFTPPTDDSSNSTDHILERLSNSKYADVRAYAAAYQDTPILILYRYLSDSDANVREIALGKIAGLITEKELRNFSANQYEDVQLTIVRHPHAPDDLVAELAGSSPHTNVRGMALTRLFAHLPSAQTQKVLSTSKHQDVLESILAYPDIDLDVLVSLASTCDTEEFRQSALEKLSKQEIPAGYLKQLAGSPHQDTQLFCCQLPKIPNELVLVWIEGTSHEAVRQKLLERIMKPRPPKNVLERLAGSRHVAVALEALKGRSVPIEMRVQLAVNSVSTSVRQKALSSIHKKDLDAGVLTQLAQSVYLDVLSKVAAHPATPADRYKELSQNLANAIQKEWIRHEEHTTQQWVEDESSPYDYYGSYYSSGGHYEDTTEYNTVIEYDNINKLLDAIPVLLKQELRGRIALLRDDRQVRWGDALPA